MLCGFPVTAAPITRWSERLVSKRAGGLRSVGPARPPSPAAGTAAGPHLPDAAEDHRFAELLAWCALAWQRPDRSEFDTVEAVIGDVAGAVFGATAAAAVMRSGPVELAVHATYTSIPVGLAALHRQVQGSPGWATASPVLGLPALGVEPSATAWPVRRCQPITGRGQVICTPLAHGSIRLGTLMIISDHGAFTPAAATQATLLARHASVAVTAARERKHLLAAVAHREEIGKAKGILMERHQLTAEQAFTQLVEISQHTNRKLHLVCADLAATSELPALPSRTR